MPIPIPEAFPPSPEPATSPLLDASGAQAVDECEERVSREDGPGPLPELGLTTLALDSPSVTVRPARIWKSNLWNQGARLPICLPDQSGIRLADPDRAAALLTLLDAGKSLNDVVPETFKLSERFWTGYYGPPHPSDTATLSKAVRAAPGSKQHRRSSSNLSPLPLCITVTRSEQCVSGEGEFTLADFVALVLGRIDAWFQNFRSGRIALDPGYEDWLIAPDGPIRYEDIYLVAISKYSHRWWGNSTEWSPELEIRTRAASPDSAS